MSLGAIRKITWLEADRSFTFTVNQSILGDSHKILSVVWDSNTFKLYGWSKYTVWVIDHDGNEKPWKVIEQMKVTIEYSI